MIANDREIRLKSYVNLEMFGATQIAHTQPFTEWKVFHLTDDECRIKLKIINRMQLEKVCYSTILCAILEPESQYFNGRYGWNFAQSHQTEEKCAKEISKR